MLDALKRDMRALADPAKAKIFAGFFKTGKGQYGEGDIFLGIMTPGQRAIAKKYNALDLESIGELLAGKIHEHRAVALSILTAQYEKASPEAQTAIFDFYLAHALGINNWDLVDLSAPRIVGDYILRHPRRKNVMYKLARSKNLWERRIAILATLAFIRAGQFEHTFALAEILMRDPHDLIHKAVGWMLRETGKRDLPALEAVLEKHATHMPRTMLRYAIERFPEDKRLMYLRRRI
jgi:3-methyladenine DNA glycosylase AlkD